MSKDSNEPQLTETILNIVKEEKPDTVKQLTSLVKEKLSINERKIIDRVLKLQSEGKIKLPKKPTDVPTEFSLYLSTEQALWYWITIATAIVARGKFRKQRRRRNSKQENPPLTLRILP